MTVLLSLTILVFHAWVSTVSLPAVVLTEKQMNTARQIVGYTPKDLDPYDLVAIALVESGLNTRSVSRTGDYGAMQIHCASHKKALKTLYGYNCETDLTDNIHNSVVAASHVLRANAKCRRCTGTEFNRFSCYNGGPGWRLERTERYVRKILRVKTTLKRFYHPLFRPTTRKTVAGLSEDHLNARYPTSRGT